MITNYSIRFQWPSWVMYDRHRRLEAARLQDDDWAKVDNSIFSSFLAGHEKGDTWCSRCNRPARHQEGEGGGHTGTPRPTRQKREAGVQTPSLTQEILSTQSPIPGTEGAGISTSQGRQVQVPPQVCPLLRGPFPEAVCAVLRTEATGELRLKEPGQGSREPGPHGCFKTDKNG